MALKPESNLLNLYRRKQQQLISKSIQLLIFFKVNSIKIAFTISL